MVKQLQCSDAGMDCDFSVRSNDEEELITMAQEHLENAHGQEMSRSDLAAAVTEI